MAIDGSAVSSSFFFKNFSFSFTWRAGDDMVQVVGVHVATQFWYELGGKGVGIEPFGAAGPVVRPRRRKLDGMRRHHRLRRRTRAAGEFGRVAIVIETAPTGVEMLDVGRTAALAFGKLAAGAETGPQ